MSLTKTQEIALKQEIERTKAGMKRNFTQIGNTITFEFKKNMKTFIVMLAFYAGIFALFWLIQELQFAANIPLPDDPVDYINGYMSMLGTLIIVSSATFGGSIIAEDFQKQTGNLVFPKISKTRLLIGRVTSHYILNGLCVAFYYILIGVFTFIKYEGIPMVLWGSMGWALLYTFTLLAFVTFLSSFMKSTSAAIITSILILLMVFQMIPMILQFAGVEAEPWFILTYYEGIITNSMAMPDPRYTELKMPTGPGGFQSGDLATFIMWDTPTEQVALIGMLTYSGVLLFFAYIFYKRRQSKSE